jgi:hypothetical protein
MPGKAFSASESYFNFRQVYDVARIKKSRKRLKASPLSGESFGLLVEVDTLKGKLSYSKGPMRFDLVFEYVPDHPNLPSRMQCHSRMTRDVR